MEPVPAHVEQLRALAPSEQLTVVAAALARSAGELPFMVNGQESHMATGPVRLWFAWRAATAFSKRDPPPPDIVKIDVEGFEGDVVDGLPTVLETVRAVVIEMHFAALTRRGMPSEPSRIIGVLRQSGFAIKWLDSSHLLATRPAV